MSGTKALAAVLLLVALASPAGLAQTAPPGKTGQTDKGAVLTDEKGMTLYVFDRDTATKSACNGQCATSWPPLEASANASASGKWSIVTRDDGSKMWAYDGKPLYRWAKDAKPGDTTGDGVNDVWHIAKP